MNPPVGRAFSRSALEGVFREGDGFDGEEFPGVDGSIAGNEIGAEVGEGVDFVEADDGVVFGGELVLAGTLGRAGNGFRHDGSSP